MNFTSKLRARPLLYRRVNLGYGTKTQKEARERVVARMRTKGHVVTKV